jgi:tetratricopeptide (TPR) repeat protein
MRRTVLGILFGATVVCSMGHWAADKPKDKAKDQETPKIEELINKGEYQKAVDLAKKFIEAQQITEGLYVDLGIAYQKLKDYPQAIAAYEEAIKLNPLGTAALMNEASCYQEQNDLVKLAETLKKVVDVDPTREDVRYSLAVLYDKQEKLDEALLQYEAIYGVNPGYKNVAYAAGVICYTKDAYDKAEPFFDKAVTLNPQDEQTLLAQGQNYLKGKKYDKAIPALKAFLEVTKNENYKPAITGTVAGLYVKQADATTAAVKDSKDKAAVAQAETAAKEAYGNALVYFDKLLVLRPNSEIALEGKANALIKMDKPQDALAPLKQYLQVSKNDAEKKKVNDLVKAIEAQKKK